MPSTFSKFSVQDPIWRPSHWSTLISQIGHLLCLLSFSLSIHVCSILIFLTRAVSAHLTMLSLWKYYLRTSLSNPSTFRGTISLKTKLQLLHSCRIPTSFSRQCTRNGLKWGLELDGQVNQIQSQLALLQKPSESKRNRPQRAAES